MIKRIIAMGVCSVAALLLINNYGVKTAEAVEVNNKVVSVNSEDEEFTLLDVSIVAKHIGEDPKSLLPEIDADLNRDGNIDKADLNIAYEMMMKNTNHKF